MSHPYRILDPVLHDEPPERGEFAGRCALTIMAKAPIPGKVKTRLSPPLSLQQAAELNACFLRDTIENLAVAGGTTPSDVVISYTPSGAESAFVGIAPAGTLLLLQRGNDFGERLLCTAQDLFSCGFSAVCLIDSDSPTVPTEEFAQAARMLLMPGRRAVLGRSTDGGYYLIGLQHAEPNLFERITWSTSAVAAETQERAREVQLPISTLAEWYDVDDAASLDRLLEELGSVRPNPNGYSAPHTRDYLQTLAPRNAIQAASFA